MNEKMRIIQIDTNKKNPLRMKAKEVEKEIFGTKKLKDIVNTLAKLLAKEEDGVAIAAPQIGLCLRIFVVSPKIYNDKSKTKPLVFINPKIIKKSQKKAVMQEGCLSVRWIYGKTKRSIGVTLEAKDLEGKKFSYGATGLLAHIFQHETEHLDGILFVDHGFDFEEFTEEEVKRQMLGARKEK